MVRKLLAVLAALLIAAPAFAANGTKLGIFVDDTDVGSADVQARKLVAGGKLMQWQGWSYEIIDTQDLAGWRTRNGIGASVADSTACRQLYAACIFLVDNNGAANAGYLNFRDQNGVTGWDKCPLSGKSQVPTYGLTSVGVKDTSNFLCGSSGKALWNANKGKWTAKGISRLRGDTTKSDTLYGTYPRCGCIHAGGDGTALIFPDTSRSDICSGDSIVFAWRYNPSGGSPFGVYWTTAAGEIANKANANVATGTAADPTSLCWLQILQDVSLRTGLLPVRKSLIDFTFDHFHYNQFTLADRSQDYDTSTVAPVVRKVIGQMRLSGIYCLGPVMSSPCERAELVGTYRPSGSAVNDPVRQFINDGFARWQPHSHKQAANSGDVAAGAGCGGTSDWTYGLATAADTAGKRQLYNVMVNGTAAADSLGYAMSSYSAYYIGAPSNKVTIPMVDMLYDAGARQFRSDDYPTSSTVSTARVCHDRQMWPAMFRTRRLGAYVWSRTDNPIDGNPIGDGFNGTGAPDEWLGTSFMKTIEGACITGADVWTDADFLGAHGDGVSVSDNSAAEWFGGAFRAWFATFNRVVAIDKFTYPTYVPAPR